MRFWNTNYLECNYPETCIGTWQQATTLAVYWVKRAAKLLSGDEEADVCGPILTAGWPWPKRLLRKPHSACSGPDAGCAGSSASAQERRRVTADRAWGGRPPTRTHRSRKRLCYA